MNVYAVIDVQNRDGIIAQHGEEAYELLHGKLRARLQGWLRKQDRLTVENGGRLCARLAGVDDVGQVNLAATKLINLTEPPYDCFGSPVKLHVIAGFTFTGEADDTSEAAIADLLDRHGTGRVLFRNTRASVTGFPRCVTRAN